MSSAMPMRRRREPSARSPWLSEQIAAIQAQLTNPVILASIAERLAVDLDQKHARLDEAVKLSASVREEINALCEPEQFSVTITNVHANGAITAEVHATGMPRTIVSVHKDVEQAAVRIGARGVLAKARNLLLRVDAELAAWNAVGTFEKQLSPREILLKHQEHSIKVTLADKFAETLADAPLKHGDWIGFDASGSGLAFERVEPPGGDDLFTEDFPDDDFAGLGGLDSQIAHIRRLIDFRIKFPHVAARYGKTGKKQRGILLYGPPGNGKTRLGRCAAAYISSLQPGRKCRFMLINAAEDYAMYLGQTEARLRARFDAARGAARQGPVLMFFDEVDGLARRRFTDHGNGACDRIQNTLLAQIDGVMGQAEIILMAATNRPDILDDAFVRPGRFTHKIEVPRPNRRAAAAILARYVNGQTPLHPTHAAGPADVIEPLLSQLYSANGEYAAIATVRLADGRRIPVPGRALLSGAFLEAVVEIAADQAADREARSGMLDGIALADLKFALDQQLAGALALITPANVKSYVPAIPRDAQPVAIE